jgi:hypothetical protein
LTRLQLNLGVRLLPFIFVKRVLTLSIIFATAVGLMAAALQRSTDRIPLLSFLQVGSHRFAFASDTFTLHGQRTAIVASKLADVQAALGAAATRDTGDASGFVRLVCYRTRGRPAMSLIFESGEMGGGTWLTGFEFVPEGSRPDLEHGCRRIGVPSSSVVTNRGLRLGLTRSAVANQLAVAERDSAGLVIFESEIDTTGVIDGKRQPRSLGSQFILGFTLGRLTALNGWRVDAC